MSLERVLIAFIGALPATLAALGALVYALRGVKKLDVVHGQINSRMDELLDVTASASRAEGKLAGQEGEPN